MGVTLGAAHLETYLGLSGEGLGLRGGGVRGTAGFGAMLAAGRKPWMMWLNWLRRFLRKLRSILAEGWGQAPGAGLAGS